MSRYNDKFTLNPGDLELIEHALESQVNQRLSPQLEIGGGGDSAVDTVRRIRELLGKLHNQKVFYSHANPSGVPLG